MHGAGMTRPPSRRARAGRARPPVGIAVSLAVALALAGCAWLPDWADPVAAYRAVVGDDLPPARDDGEPPVAEAGEASFPNLGSVPDRAPATSSAAERRRIVEGLVADRRNARHAGAGAADQAAAPAPPSTAAPAAQLGRVAVPSIVQGGPRPIVPPRAGAPRLRSVVPAPPAPSTSVSEPLPAPPAAAPPTVVVLQPPPTAASPPPSPRDDFATVGQVFAARIAQSGATVTTAPAHLGLSTPAPPADEPPSAEAEAGSGAAPPAGPRPVGPAADRPVIVYFANGSSRIAARESAKVAEVARRYKADGAGAVRIVGHASSRTLNLPIDRHKLVNLWISMDRAEAVARELVRRGVAPDAIVVEARADNEPQFFESMPAAEAHNRRAEVYLEF